MSWLYLPGGGGGLLASKLLGWRTICYVEWNSYCVEVLKARIRDRYIDDAPIWDDCFSFDGIPWAGLVDVISAGFPCQPFSSAGKGLAENDPRDGWPALKRIIGEVRPKIAWLENVPGIISKPYIRRIFGDLAEIGYDAEWGTLSAAEVGANHKRDRLWIVAYSQSIEEQLQLLAWQDNLQSSRNGKIQSMADTNIKRCSEFEIATISDKSPQSTRCTSKNRRGEWFRTEPRMGRVVDGVAHRLDRLEAIGNGQVPEVARVAWELLTARIAWAPE